LLRVTDQLAAVEKKRSAFEQLSSIEKNFAVLRDRLVDQSQIDAHGRQY